MYLSDWLLNPIPEPIRADSDNPGCGNQQFFIDQLRNNFFNRLAGQSVGIGEAALQLGHKKSGLWSTRQSPNLLQ
jgi:hypothetical protein